VSLRKWLCLKQQELKEQWADGDYTGQQHFETALLNAAAIGRCKTLKELEELEFEQLVGDMKDE